MLYLSSRSIRDVARRMKRQPVAQRNGADHRAHPLGVAGPHLPQGHTVFAIARNSLFKPLREGPPDDWRATECVGG